MGGGQNILPELFRVSLRSFKRNSGPYCKVRSNRGKSCMSIIINLYVTLLCFGDIFLSTICLKTLRFVEHQACSVRHLLVFALLSPFFILAGFLFHRNLWNNVSSFLISGMSGSGRAVSMCTILASRRNRITIILPIGVRFLLVHWCSSRCILPIFFLGLFL